MMLNKLLALMLPLEKLPPISKGFATYAYTTLMLPVFMLLVMVLLLGKLVLGRLLMALLFYYSRPLCY